MLKAYIINGPNMNLLGRREVDIYGDTSLSMLEMRCQDQFQDQIDQSWFQSHYEGKIIERIHEAIEHDIDAIIINPAALSHYSIAILDALKCFDGYKIEVHISDIFNRESFRQTSITASACDKLICGMGIDGYIMALEQLINNTMQ